MTIQALIFDFDGLILDTEWPALVSLTATFAAHGVELPVDEWRTGIGTTDKRHWSEWLEELVGRPIDREAARATRLDHHHALIAREEVRPGVVALLDQAKAAAIPVAVASSSPADWVEGHLGRRGLRSRFVHVITRDDVERTKPAPDLYLRALDALGVAAGSAVALEDSAHGATAAAAAGICCVVVPNRVTEGQELARADLVAASLADLDLDQLSGLLDVRARTAG